MANFTKMEQAERMLEKLGYYRECVYSPIGESPDEQVFEKIIDLENGLQDAIFRIKQESASVKDWKIFNWAVNKRNELDVINSIKKALHK